jgi:hypothetical protein
MKIFKTEQQKAEDRFAKRLLKEILQTDQFKFLAAQVKKQQDFDELQAQPLNYPILQDLMNAAQTGVSIDVKFIDGTQITMRPDATASLSEQEKAARIRELNEQHNKQFF